MTGNRIAPPRFVLDAHLGGLAAYLRMLGFDTLWFNDVGDEELARISLREERILLSRDRPLLGRRDIGAAYRVQAERSKEQLAEVTRHFGLTGWMAPFTRCMKCNTALRSVGKAQVRDRLLSDTARIFDEFYECPGCLRVYWKGSHYDRMRRMVEALSQDHARTG
jgi:uncharacterized protein with PIN domain